MRNGFEATSSLFYQNDALADEWVVALTIPDSRATVICSILTLAIAKSVHTSYPSSKDIPVMAIIGTCAINDPTACNLLISRVASSPDITGISSHALAIELLGPLDSVILPISIRINDKSFPFWLSPLQSFVPFINSTASRPLLATYRKANLPQLSPKHFLVH